MQAYDYSHLHCCSLLAGYAIDVTFSFVIKMHFNVFGRWKASLIATTVVVVFVVTVFEKCLRLC